MPQSWVSVSHGGGDAGDGGRPLDRAGPNWAAARPSAWNWPNCGPDGDGDGGS